MINELVIALLAVAALAFVSAPLRRPESPATPDPTTELEDKKMVALTAILDLESERAVGKLSEADFAELRAVYEADALDALHRLDAAATSGGADPLEREIARVRARLSGGRCSVCGTSLDAATSACPRCGG